MKFFFIDSPFRCCIAVCFITLIGCGNDSSVGLENLPLQTDSTSSTDETKKLNGVIPAYQLQALEKAKGVEGILQQVDDDRRQALEDSGL